MARRPPIDGRPFAAPATHTWSDDPMVNPEWGTKRTCPKCSTRFYDLGKEDPVTCISCGNAWLPEPVLKSKQPLPFEVAAPEKAEQADEDLAAEELVPDEDEEPSADEEVDLDTGEDDLGVATGDEDEES
jgi:uncharacterized protein (TIGR02300 family)